MIELFDDFLVMFHLLVETFSIFIDWIGEVFMQIGLVIVVLRGYLRHLWVSEIFQCHTNFVNVLNGNLRQNRRQCR